MRPKLRNFYLLTACLGASLLCSCDNNFNERSHGPIILNDSATIVTETDPRYLVDSITDFGEAEMMAEELLPAISKDTFNNVAAAAALAKQQEADSINALKAQKTEQDAKKKQAEAQQGNAKQRKTSTKNRTQKTQSKQKKQSTTKSQNKNQNNKR